MAPSRNIRAGRAYVEIAADSTKLSRGLREAQVQLKSFGRAAQEVGREMLALSTAMAMPFAFSAKSFASFDDSMRLAQAVTQATGEDFEQLTRAAQRLGRETSFTAQQVADAMVSLGRMGFSPREIENSIADVLNLARATGTELAEAADFAANSMRIFAIESTDMARVADVLTVTANSSAQTLVDLFEALKIAGPQAKAAGENIEETSAALGVLANMGIKGSLAGTALRKSFSQFAKIDVQNTLAQWGVRTTDAEGNLRKLAEVMVDIAKVMQTMPTAQRLTFAEEIFDLRGSLAGLSITANTKALEDFIIKLQDVGGVAAETALKMDAGLGGSFRLLASAAEGSMNAVGDTLSRTLQPMIAQMITALNSFTGWIEANGEFVTKIAASIATVAALGAALLVLGTAAKICGAGIGVLRVATDGVVGAWGMLRTVATGVGSAISSIAYAFANYNNMAQPALVSTSRFLAALRLPIDTRANQIAASLVLMSNAETAATVKSTLAAKWKAITAILTRANLATLASAAATKAHALADLAAAGASKVVATARALTALVTGKVTLATGAATAATIAATTANTALAVSAKATAAAYLALNGVLRAFAAIPIAAIAVAAAGAIALWYRNVAKAGEYTAKLKEEMKGLREEGDKTRKMDQLRMERLEQLAQKQSLSNAEMDEADRLSSALRDRYAGLGIEVDRLSNRLTLAADAQGRFAEAIRSTQVAQLQAELAELEANYAELERHQAANYHWTNFNLWSKLTGNWEETNADIASTVDKMNAVAQAIDAKRVQIALAQRGELDGTAEDEAALTDAIEAETMTRIASEEDIANASKRTAEIERTLRREQQTDLANEIEDIEALRDEYIALMETLRDYQIAQKNLAGAEAMELRIAQARLDAAARIERAQAKAKEADAEAVAAARQQLERDFARVENAATVSSFDRNLATLQKQDKSAAVGILENLTTALERELQQARTDYLQTFEEAIADGALSKEEDAAIASAQDRFARTASALEKYTSQLASAREATDQAEKTSGGTAIGSFYAAALRGLGIQSVQDKQLKAAETTAKNSKKTVQLLEDIAASPLAFI